MNGNNKLLSIYLLIFNINQILCSERFIVPSRTFSQHQSRAFRSNNNMMLYANNDLSDTIYSDVRQSNPIYQQLPKNEITSTTTTTTTTKPSVTINNNRTSDINRVYISKPIAQTTYLPNHITNKEIANLLKNVNPVIEFSMQPQNTAVQNAVESELETTASDTQFIKGLKSVQLSVMKMAQSIKDFCVYVWRFFSTGELNRR